MSPRGQVRGLRPCKGHERRFWGCRPSQPFGQAAVLALQFGDAVSLALVRLPAGREFGHERPQHGGDRRLDQRGHRLGRRRRRRTLSTEHVLCSLFRGYTVPCLLPRQGDEVGAALGPVDALRFKLAALDHPPDGDDIHTERRRSLDHRDSCVRDMSRTGRTVLSRECRVRCPIHAVQRTACRVACRATDGSRSSAGSLGPPRVTEGVVATIPPLAEGGPRVHSGPCVAVGDVSAQLGVGLSSEDAREPSPIRRRRKVNESYRARVDREVDEDEGSYQEEPEPPAPP